MLMSDARGRARPHDAVVDERYPGIDSYALIDDCHSAALVSRAGSVDWACLRRFDAGSVFGRLHWESGGHFCLTPGAVRDVSRRYLDETMVLACQRRPSGVRQTRRGSCWARARTTSPLRRPPHIATPDARRMHDRMR